MDNKPVNKENNGDLFELSFNKINYILMAVGIVLLAVGYILLSGGGSDDPNVFNPAMPGGALTQLLYNSILACCHSTEIKAI